MKTFKVAIIDDDAHQLKIITRKMSYLFSQEIKDFEVIISAYPTIADFHEASNTHDYHIVDYEIEDNYNGVKLIQNYSLSNDGVIFTGNIKLLSQDELDFLKNVNYGLVEKPNFNEVAKSAIHYIYTKKTQQKR